MNHSHSPSDDLYAGWRSLEGIKGVDMLSGLTWCEAESMWTLHCRLSPDLSTECPIPAGTEWHVLIAPDYPSGEIKFYPAKERGIVQTFPHQDYNGEGSPDLLWRTGDLCLDTTVRVLGRHGYDTEPRDADSRLRWHFLRAMAWLEAASQGELLALGDPFELPKFPPSYPATVVFAEGAESFDTWQGISDRSGVVEFLRLSEEPETLVVKCFRSVAWTQLMTPRWGQALAREMGASHKGVWVRLNQVPVLAPWQAPCSFEELIQVCKLQGIDFLESLKLTACFLRDGKRHVALVGFPVPKKVGGSLQQMHWQAMMLPVLSRGNRTANGFRPNETGYWFRDRQEILRPDTPVDWLFSSENWHRDQILTRGRLPDGLISKSILLVGAGAVGSAFGELLVRAGAPAMIIMDGESLQAGNLARHTLGLDDLGKNKATRLADRLNSLSPHASVQGIDHGFPPEAGEEAEQVQKCQVVIDCTADDDVIRRLEAFQWNEAQFFASISLGFGAKRLFIFTAHTETFPSAQFRAAWEPWLRHEIKDYEGKELPWEGIGCWHPVFPARADDVWMMSSVAVKHLAVKAAQSSGNADFQVFEQLFQDGVFTGITEASLGYDSG
jgi:hypothetical protein